MQITGITAPWTGLGNKTHQKKWGFSKSGAGLSASRANMHRRRQDVSFSCCIYGVKQLLNRIQHQKRFTWAEDKKVLDCWRVVQIMCSDEDKLCMSFGSRGPRVWRKIGEAQNPRCFRQSFTCRWWFGVLRHQLALVHCVFLAPRLMQLSASTFQSTSCFLLLTNFTERHISFPNRTWHLHMQPKLAVPGLRTMASLFFTGQQTLPDLKEEDVTHLTQQLGELKAAITATWAFITPDRSSPCHAALLQQFGHNRSQLCIECCTCSDFSVAQHKS